MQFTTALVALLAAMPLAAAAPNQEKRDLHNLLYCVNDTPAQNFKVGEQVTENNGATDKACAAYRNRNTGTKQWDTCPDCVVTIGHGSLVHVCNSAGKHLGGDEMTYYCKQAGASRGAA